MFLSYVDILDNIIITLLIILAVGLFLNDFLIFRAIPRKVVQNFKRGIAESCVHIPCQPFEHISPPLHCH